MNARIKKNATVTSKGQVTLPLAIRQGLHLNAGSKVEFELVGDTVVMTRLDSMDDMDPDIQALLEHIRVDTTTGFNLGLLKPPDTLLGKLLSMTARTKDIHSRIDGDVSL